MSSTPITIEVPKTNTAEAWNTAVKEGADKAGVALPTPGAPAAAAKKEDDAPTIYEASVTVNGKPIVVQDSDPAKVIEKLSAAVQAAQAASEAAAAAPAKVEEPKPAFTEAELFDLSLKLQKGDVTALDEYVEKSGALDRALEKRGIKVADLKEQIESGQTQKEQAEWQAATVAYNAKIKAGESDFPGGAQNVYIMGMMLAELGLKNKPSVESFDLAYAEMKKRNMVFPVTKTETTQQTTQQTTAKTEEPKVQKVATSSTAVGTHGPAGGKETQPQAAAGVYELDIRELTPKQYQESYNEVVRRLIAGGVPPEKVKDHIKIIQ